jgi:hypothetical protein
MKRIATFKLDGKMLTGAAAVTAWAKQSAHCNCGSYGAKSEAISGTCSDMPAKWLGCTNCSGQALGRPLVYRLPSQMEAQ